jgi:hypothetical protein
MGHSWLRKHNPDIDWVTGDVKMSHCSGQCCSGCWDEIREEQKAQKLEVCCLSDCSVEDLPDDEDDDEDESGSEIDRDCIFVPRAANGRNLCHLHRLSTASRSLQTE